MKVMVVVWRVSYRLFIARPFIVGSNNTTFLPMLTIINLRQTFSEGYRVGDYFYVIFCVKPKISNQCWLNFVHQIFILLNVFAVATSCGTYEETLIFAMYLLVDPFEFSL